MLRYKKGRQRPATRTVRVARHTLKQLKDEWWSVVIVHVVHRDSEEIISPIASRQPTQLTSVGRNVYVLTEVKHEANAAVDKPLKSQVQHVSESMVYQAAVVKNRKDE